VSAGAPGAPQGPPATLHLTVSGRPREIAAGTTVADLLAALGAAGQPCAVEVNRAIVPRSAHAAHWLREGDVVEIVGFVGGG
jgi:sulfur carrier protein